MTVIVYYRLSIVATNTYHARFTITNREYTVALSNVNSSAYKNLSTEVDTEVCINHLHY